MLHRLCNQGPNPSISTESPLSSFLQLVLPLHHIPAEPLPLVSIQVMNPYSPLALDWFSINRYSLPTLLQIARITSFNIDLPPHTANALLPPLGTILGKSNIHLRVVIATGTTPL